MDRVITIVFSPIKEFIIADDPLQLIADKYQKILNRLDTKEKTTIITRIYKSLISEDKNQFTDSEVIVNKTINPITSVREVEEMILRIKNEFNGKKDKNKPIIEEKKEVEYNASPEKEEAKQEDVKKMA
jgi:hypothetical protein